MTMDNTTIISIILSALGGVISFGGTFVFNWMRSELSDIKKEQHDVMTKVGTIEITLATILEQIKHKADK